MIALLFSALSSPCDLAVFPGRALVYALLWRPDRRCLNFFFSLRFPNFLSHVFHHLCPLCYTVAVWYFAVVVLIGEISCTNTVTCPGIAEPRVALAASLFCSAYGCMRFSRTAYLPETSLEKPAVSRLVLFLGSLFVIPFILLLWFWSWFWFDSVSVSQFALFDLFLQSSFPLASVSVLPTLGAFILRPQLGPWRTT